MANREYVFLIEKRFYEQFEAQSLSVVTRYLSVRMDLDHTPAFWTTDVNEAVRFPRKIDAYQIAAALKLFPEYHVREHGWSDGTYGG